MTETGKRLQMNSRNPVFFLGYGEALTCALARVDRLPHTIYTNQNHGRAELDAAGFIRAEENDKRTHIKNS